ncbi:hypothetical protein B0A48_17806 [Cryoendolithus antarcticus]|uniref:Uncharacterized protein n=1 Tax=Cryoendolithus antarcticus TaxID=1507870 RepID=A0A1V8SAL0_9PEZI|nr:hypothetical protein B0A48_17806 [Cryoendolithus antarcticus]
MRPELALVIALAAAVFAAPLPVESSTPVATADSHSPIATGSVSSSPPDAGTASSFTSTSGGAGTSITGTDRGERLNPNRESRMLPVKSLDARAPPKQLASSYMPWMKTAMGGLDLWPRPKKACSPDHSMICPVADQGRAAWRVALERRYM